MALSGISALVAVTQMKADAANADAGSQAAKRLGTRPALHEALHATADSFGLVKAATPGVLDGIKASFEAKDKDLESQDKLGNFEIQDLMSNYNEAQTTMSSLLKKLHDTANSTIGTF